MRIQIGAPIRTREGKDLGKAHKVIIDPHQNKITHMVVDTGHFFGRRVVIPIEAVRKSSHGRVYLKLSEKELGEMPDFLQTEYAAPPQGWIPPFDLPPGGVLWPGGYVYVPLIVEQEERVPKDSIEVNRSTEVFALDGKIGVVDQVVVDQRSKSIIGFVVAKGKYLPESVCVPVAWVSAAGGGRLSLNRTRSEIIAQGKSNAAA